MLVIIMKPLAAVLMIHSISYLSEQGVALALRRLMAADRPLIVVDSLFQRELMIFGLLLSEFLVNMTIVIEITHVINLLQTMPTVESLQVKVVMVIPAESILRRDISYRYHSRENPNLFFGRVEEDEVVVLLCAGCVRHSG